MLTDDEPVGDGARAAVEEDGDAAGGEPPYWANARGRDSRNRAVEEIIVDFWVW